MGKKLAIVGGVVGVAVVGGLAYLLYKANEELKVSSFIGEDGMPDLERIDNAMERYGLGGYKRSDSAMDTDDGMSGYQGKVNMNVKKSTDI
mgnify:CR=1 FL=1